MAKILMYVEYQTSKDFSELDIEKINSNMKKFPGLVSKTWLSGINNNSLGGFYEFDSLKNAQNYIDNGLYSGVPTYGNLTVKLFNGDIVKDASIGMNSPYYEKK